MFWLYLITGPRRKQAPGIYRAGYGACSDDLGWQMKDIKASFKELIDAEMMQWDPDNNVIYLPNWPKYNRPPANPNVLKAWLNILDGIPDCDLKTKYIEILRDVIETAENHSASLDVYSLWVETLKPVKRPVKRPKKAPVKVSDELMNVSKSYHDKVKHEFPNLSIFKNGGMSTIVKMGAVELEKLINKDNHALEEVTAVLDWVISSYDERQEFNWLPNCQSLRSIRKKSKNGNPKYDNISNDYMVNKSKVKAKEIDYSNDEQPF